MATIKDSQQHQIKDLASADSEENIPTSRETVPLLQMKDETPVQE